MYEFIGWPSERGSVSSLMCRDFKLHKNSLLEQKKSLLLLSTSVSWTEIVYFAFFFVCFIVSNPMNLFRWHFPPKGVLAQLQFWVFIIISFIGPYIISVVVQSCLRCMCVMINNCIEEKCKWLCFPPKVFMYSYKNTVWDCGLYSFSFLMTQIA